MGLALANQRGFDLPARQPFIETLAQLIIGVLFISISATVAPQSLRHLILPTLGLTAVLVFLAPLAAFASTLRTDLGTGERAFTGWMAPRGIVGGSNWPRVSCSRPPPAAAPGSGRSRPCSCSRTRTTSTRSPRGCWRHDLLAGAGAGSPVRRRAGAAFQLLLNVILLIAVGAAALRAQRIIWRPRERRGERQAWPRPGP